jgi:hypothetical protein
VAPSFDKRLVLDFRSPSGEAGVCGLYAVGPSRSGLVALPIFCELKE